MKTYTYYLCSILMLLITSCSKDDNPSNPIIEFGSITGKVNLFGPRGEFSLNENMQVSIERSDPLITVFTDEDGIYRFDNIPYGRYDLRFEKEGFGTFKRGDIIHRSEETVIESSENLSKKSTTGISQLVLSETDTGITIALVTSPPANTLSERYVRLFFNTGGQASSTIFEHFTPILRAESTPFTLNFTFQEFRELGFIQGAPIYIKAYGESFFSNEYIDPNNGDFIFPNLNLNNTTNGVSFIVP